MSLSNKPKWSPPVDTYDRIYGELHGLAAMARPSTIVEGLPVVGNVTTWVVQVASHNDASIAFVQGIDAEGQVRLVLPGKVVAAIVRQESRLRAARGDKRSEERKAADAERERIRAAKALLVRKREERRARRAANGLD